MKRILLSVLAADAVALVCFNVLLVFGGEWSFSLGLFAGFYIVLFAVVGFVIGEGLLFLLRRVKMPTVAGTLLFLLLGAAFGQAVTGSTKMIEPLFVITAAAGSMTYYLCRVIKMPTVLQ